MRSCDKKIFKLPSYSIKKGDNDYRYRITAVLKVETNIITITAETITAKSVILIDIEVKTFKTEVTVNWLRHNVFDVALTDNFQYHPYQSVRSKKKISKLPINMIMVI